MVTGNKTMVTGKRTQYGRDSPSINPSNGGVKRQSDMIPVPAEDLSLMLDFLEKMNQAAQVNLRIIARLRQLLEDE